MSLLLIMLLILTTMVLLLMFYGPKPDLNTLHIIDETLNEELPELVRGKTGFAVSNNVGIWYELIPPTTTSIKGTVCLLMSNAADALMWPPSFINQFTSAGFQVIRLDYRGTGLSDWMSNWNKNNPYSLFDMAKDVISVIDTLHISRVHLFGFSFGGMIAQEIAINNPERISSLTLMMTTGDATDPKMKTMSTSYVFSSIIKSIPIIKYRILGGERNLIIERILKMQAGQMNFDVKETAQQVLYDLRNRKGINFKAVFQHFKAVEISGSRYEKLKDIKTPTLIIHGTKDNIF
ncbi:MAG TPA: alpha/beta hydrolase, partial [Anaerolineales bacterium]|nr:alpha/beta hydrolase [Anaerolineales bacterium]